MRMMFYSVRCRHMLISLTLSLFCCFSPRSASVLLSAISRASCCLSLTLVSSSLSPSYPSYLSDMPIAFPLCKDDVGDSDELSYGVRAGDAPVCDTGVVVWDVLQDCRERGEINGAGLGLAGTHDGERNTLATSPAPALTFKRN